MIILEHRRDFYGTLLKILPIVAGGFFILGILCLLFFLGFFRQKSSASYGWSHFSKTADLNSKILNHSLFALHRQESLQLPNIEEELQLRAVNTRPDARDLEKEIGQPRFLLAFRGHLTPLAIRSGQTVYFAIEQPGTTKEAWNGPPAPLSIKDSPTPWKMTPIALEGQIFLEVRNTQEKTEVLLQETQDQPTPFHEKAVASAWFKALKDGKFWLDDCFSPAKEGQVKIGFGKQNTEKVVLASLGDTLFFAAGEWQMGKMELAKGRPLARILAKDDRGITLEAWDETGFFYDTLRLSSLPMASYSFVKVESLFSSLKQRNASEVSCIMGKRRVVLKPGTWWIKTHRGWHRLKRRSEIEDYLSCRLLGELIAVDALESLHGKTLVKGRLIDPLRRHAEPFSLEVAESPGRMKKSIPAPAVEPPSPENKMPRPMPRNRRETASP